MKRTSLLTQQPAVVESSPEGLGFTQGDEVVITGERGWYKFMYYAIHTRSGAEWLTLYGGQKDPGGERGFRAVEPNRVRSRR